MTQPTQPHGGQPGISLADHLYSENPTAKRIVLAVTVIFALGTLIAAATGLASFGMSQHWWNYSFTPQLPLTYQIIMMASGGSIAITSIVVAITLMKAKTRPIESPSAHLPEASRPPLHTEPHRAEAPLLPPPPRPVDGLAAPVHMPAEILLRWPPINGVQGPVTTAMKRDLPGEVNDGTGTAFFERASTHKIVSEEKLPPERVIPEQGRLILSFIKPKDLNHKVAFESKGREYYSWYEEETASLLIQKKEDFEGSNTKLKVKFNSEGQVTLINGKPQINNKPDIPTAWLEGWEGLHHQAFKAPLNLERVISIIQSNSYVIEVGCDRSFTFQVGCHKYRTWWEFSSCEASRKLKKEAGFILYIESMDSPKNRLAITLNRNYEIDSVQVNGVPSVDQVIPLEWQHSLASLWNRSGTLTAEDLPMFRAALKSVDALLNHSIIDLLPGETDPKLAQLWAHHQFIVKKDPRSGCRLTKIRTENRDRIAVVLREATTNYLVWFSEKDSTYSDRIIIESFDSFSEQNPLRKNRLEIGISDEGAIQSLRVMDFVASPDSEDRIREIPQRYLGIFRVALQMAMVISSKYYINGNIQIVQRGLKVVPQYHLHRLSLMLAQSRRIKVEFLNDAMHRTPGVDAGGLRRHYLSSLFEGIVHDTSLTFARSDATGLYQPLALFADEAAMRVYRQWGEILMFCYLPFHRTLTTGVYLDQSTVIAALSLSAAEIRDAAGNTEGKILLKILRILFELEQTAFQTEDGEIISGKEMIGLMLDTAHRWTDEELEQGRRFLQLLSPEVPAPTSDRGNAQHALITALKQSILDSTFIPFQRIAPVVALAQGMKDFLKRKTRLDWDSFLAVGNGRRRADGSIGLDPKAFCLKAQGTLVRHEIAEAFTTDSTHPAIVTKLRWLKEWLLDEGTAEEEVRNMLIFLSGSAGVLGPNTIKIQTSSRQSPFPVVHTCFLTVELYTGFSEQLGMHDRDAENFIRCLKQAATVEGFSMA